MYKDIQILIINSLVNLVVSLHKAMVLQLVKGNLEQQLQQSIAYGVDSIRSWNYIKW